MQFQEQVMTKDYIRMIKRKRTKTQRIASIYPLTMVTSSSSTAGAVVGGGDGFSIAGTVVSTDVSGSSDCITLTPSNSINSGEFTQSTTDEVEEEEDDDEEEEDMANCLILLAKGSSQMSSSQVPLNEATVNKTEPLTVADHVAVNYQCKTCNKSFSSFQALGGHRASHKRSPIIKPIFTSAEDKTPLAEFKEENVPSNKYGRTSTTNIVSLKITSKGLFLGSQVPQNKSRIHECSLCGAEFASGQALGGHMRRHRHQHQLPAAAAICSNKKESQEAAKKPRNVLSLDLNLPAPEVMEDQREYSNLPFAPKEQVVVFSRPAPLVDCHY